MFKAGLRWIYRWFIAGLWLVYRWFNAGLTRSKALLKAFELRQYRVAKGWRYHGSGTSLPVIISFSLRLASHLTHNHFNAVITMEDKEIQQNGAETAETGSDLNINADENAAGTTHLNEPVAEQSEEEKLKADLAEQKDKYLRLYADFDNFRKRTAKERLEYMQAAGKDVIVNLLEVLDDCDRAEKQMQADGGDVKQMKEGVLLIFNKLRSSLQGRGLKAMQSLHAEFDVEKHEAITEIPAPKDNLKGKVVDEIQKGYYLNDKIIRHAKVVVGK